MLSDVTSNYVSKLSNTSLALAQCAWSQAILVWLGLRDLLRLHLQVP